MTMVEGRVWYVLCFHIKREENNSDSEVIDLTKDEDEEGYDDEIMDDDSLPIHRRNLNIDSHSIGDETMSLIEQDIELGEYDTEEEECEGCLIGHCEAHDDL